MRKGRLRKKIPKQLLPGREPVVERISGTPQADLLATKIAQKPKNASFRAKRLVALCVVIIVSVSIPILALVLIFTG